MMVILFTALLSLTLALFLWQARRRRARLLATVTEVVLPDVASEHLGNARDVFAYLPPDYGEHGRAYPLLLINDGQDRGLLQLRETLATLFARRQVRPFVTVAIPTNADRLHEYGTAVAPNAQGLGSRAAAYSQFVTQELLPLLWRRFHVQRAATAVLGASLGGLSAFDLAWNHPELFDTAGVLSGSFWWRAADDETRITPGRRIAHELVRLGGPRPGLRFWFEAATQDEVSDRDNNGVIDAIQDTLELIDALKTAGYGRGGDLVYVEVPGGRHNWPTWAAVLPQFLRWRYGA